MKKPVTIGISREHGNSGDCIVTVNAADGKTSFAVPGDCTPYTALTALRPFLEQIINAVEPDDVPVSVEPESVEVDSEGFRVGT